MLHAQIGGRGIYDFLNLTPSARIGALGGFNVSTIDEDVNFGFQNPALVSPAMHGNISLSIVNYLSDIGYGYASYSHTIDKVGSFHSGIHYVNYGKMEGADVFGNLTGEFSANDIAWLIGFSRSWKQFRYGSNMKLIHSNLAPGYNSFGMSFDFGASYQSKNELFSAGLVMRNLGLQFSTYVPGASKEPLPFEIMAGISNKLKYMPLRFSVTLTHLEHPNLIYDDPNAEPALDFDGNPLPPENRIGDKIFSHFVFGTEFLLGNAFRLRGGYNHLRRQELRAENRAGLSGFSLGVGIKIKRFAFDYGYTSYGFSSTFNAHNFSLLFKLPGQKSTPKEETSTSL